MRVLGVVAGAQAREALPLLVGNSAVGYAPEGTPKTKSSGHNAKITQGPQHVKAD